MRWHPLGCSTSRAARPGPITVSTSPSMVFNLARALTPERAGRLAVALNGCSRRTGRRFWKATTWTSAAAVGPYLDPAPVWLYLQHQKDPEHRPRRRELQVLVKEISKGHLMKKFLVVICSVVLALGLAGCIGKGKAPVGKGKAPVVQTRG